MDKDSIILKYIKEESNDCENEINKLKSQNNDNIERINKIDNELDEIYKLLNKPRKSVENITSNTVKEEKSKTLDRYTQKEKSYDELFDRALQSLRERGIDVENMDYHNLVSEAELNEITSRLNRPLDKKEKWVKNDFIAVFVAASIGSLIDFILSDRNNKFTGKESDFSKWLNQFHKHESGSPIDYQGEGFGGGFHRGLSKGHDILRFIEAIIMIKEGRFEGIRYSDSVAHKVVSYANQYGNPYEQLSLIEAIVKYAKHMFADLFSTCSLSFPGHSFLLECGNREIRKFAVTMYQQGFNLKNIMIQSLSTIIIEVIIRIYFDISEVKKYKDTIEIKEDYSNFKAFIRLMKLENNKAKLNEMLLVSHSIVCGMNIGKIIITKQPWSINITEIISVVKYTIPVIENLINRHSDYAKIIRNTDEIKEDWDNLAIEFDLDKIELQFPSNVIEI